MDACARVMPCDPDPRVRPEEAWAAAEEFADLTSPEVMQSHVVEALTASATSNDRTGKQTRLYETRREISCSPVYQYSEGR